MKKELIQIYVDFKSTLLNELELIQNVNNWFENNSDKIKPECFHLFTEIQRLNTKSSERNKAFPVLERIIDIIEPNFESIKKPYYLITFKKGCELLISKSISPYDLSRILTQVECEFNFPKWTGNLYNALDWIDKDSPLELNMIEESKEIIIEIKKILKTQYNIGYN